MTATDKKKILKERYLKPKLALRRERRAREFTTDYMASLVGLSREQYERKEAGKFPFNDIEMIIIAKELDKEIKDIFFNE